jgi:hypothetical protein
VYHHRLHTSGLSCTRKIFWQANDNTIDWQRQHRRQMSLDQKYGVDIPNSLTVKLKAIPAAFRFSGRFAQLSIQIDSRSH